MLFALDGGIDLKKIMLIVLAMVLVALTGCSLAANYPLSFPATPTYVNGYNEINTTFNFEQSVQGNGYFMTYMYAKSGNLAFKNYAHGSGSVNNEATLTYQHLNKSTHNAYTDYNDYELNCIQFKEDNAMVYAPMRIAVGTGYYAARPLDYSSLLKEKTTLKNYRAGTSMHHEVEYAHALDKELDATLKETFNYTYDPVIDGNGFTQMRVTEDVTDGKAHIGVLQANENFAGRIIPRSASGFIDDGLSYSAWKDPAIEIDEDYWGTYHIEKNMTLHVPYYLKQTSDDWLPCCTGGYDYLDAYTKKKLGSAKGIFDCTCYKVPTQAQFPRIY